MVVCVYMIMTWFWIYLVFLIDAIEIFFLAFADVEHLGM